MLLVVIEQAVPSLSLPNLPAATYLLVICGCISGSVVFFRFFGPFGELSVFSIFRLISAGIVFSIFWGDFPGGV